jgi:hypothetical protein
MKPRKSFAEHLRNQDQTEPLQESLFSKGYAIGQQARFNSTKSQLKSALSRVDTAARAAKMSTDLELKLNHFADAAHHLSDAIILQAEMMKNVMNVAVANTLLADDLTKRK